jgi:hypothetical protein
LGVINYIAVAKRQVRMVFLLSNSHHGNWDCRWARFLKINRLKSSFSRHQLFRHQKPPSRNRVGVVEDFGEVIYESG